MVWDVKRCMRDGGNEEVVNVRVNIVGVGQRRSYNDNTKSLQKFDVMAGEYQGNKKTKTLTLFDAPDAETCMGYVGNDLVAPSATLKRRDNQHKPGETYLAEITTNELISIEAYEAKYGASAAVEQGESLPGTKPRPENCAPLKPKSGNGKVLTNEEMKAEVTKTQRFLFHLFDEWRDVYQGENVPVDTLQRLAVTTFITCKSSRMMPDYDINFAEPSEEVASEEIAVSPAPVPVENFHTLRPKYTQKEVADKRKYAEAHPEFKVVCSDCGEPMAVKLLSITEDGAFCEACEKIPF